MKKTRTQPQAKPAEPAAPAEHVFRAIPDDPRWAPPADAPFAVASNGRDRVKFPAEGDFATWLALQVEYEGAKIIRG